MLPQQEHLGHKTLFKFFTGWLFTLFISYLPYFGVWKAATEAATMILRVDNVIASGKMKAPPMPPGGMPGGGYGGMPPEY